MNPKLHISKHEIGCTSKKKTQLKFSVVDLDKSSNYPSNFLCQLPTSYGTPNWPQTVFAQIFGDKSKHLAEQLLKKATESETDAHVLTEISIRLEKLEKLNFKPTETPQSAQKKQARTAESINHGF